MEDKVCVKCGGSGVLPGRELCTCVQKSLLKKIYGVFYPWAKREVRLIELVGKIKESCVIYTSSVERANRVVVEYLLKVSPLTRNFIKLDSSDIISDYLSRDMQIIDEVLPEVTIIEVGNLVMPNKQEVNLVVQFIKDRRRDSKFVVISYNKMDFQKHAKALGLQELVL